MNHLLSAGIAILEGMFFVGLIGSAVVILLTTVEDVGVLASRDKTPLPPES